MKQFQFGYKTYEQFRNELTKIRQWQNARIVSKIVLQVYSVELESSVFRKMFAAIDEILPDAIYLGCSTNGNIIDGKIAKSDIVIVCTIFEYPSTHVQILQYDFKDFDSAEMANQLNAVVSHNPWVTAIEFLVTIRGKSMTTFCDRMSNIREDVVLFGGGAFAPDLSSSKACVYSNEHGYSNDGAIFMLLGGEDFHIETLYIAGWKPLGRVFRVTAADGCILKELDYKPAYDAYYKYLSIKNDENFFYNTLEFPFLYQHNGIDLLRAPVASNADGSLVMTSDMDEDVNARIAYGDPWTILESVHQGGERIRAFQPEIIHIYSCAARKTFWGTDEVSKETLPFQTIAPTSGFFTSGEFLRTGKYLNQHNVTLVIAAMREGEKSCKPKTFEMQKEVFSGKVSMINRLATFIEAATEELEEANRKLALSVITDGMTQLLNRSEITRLIRCAVKQKSKKEINLCLVMLDIDDFKRVNDTCGHKEGDNVIIALSDILRETAKTQENISAGRWGGEEFMLLFQDYPTDDVQAIAECIRREFSETAFEKSEPKTVSIGIVTIQNAETPDAACIRVDNALYEAKKSGKNKIVVL